MSPETMVTERLPPRRDFLKLVTGATAAIGAAALVWPMIDSMNPAADVIAAGAPMDIDLTKIASGQQVIVRWRGAPILIVNRTPQVLKTLRSASLIHRLSDPDSKVHQQPSYAENWHRSIKPEIAVLVGICTHLGCLPSYMPTPDPTTPAPDWPGGYFCPCHGSKYDLAGRVYSGVPAPYNLPVPARTRAAAAAGLRWRCGRRQCGWERSCSSSRRISPWWSASARMGALAPCSLPAGYEACCRRRGTASTKVCRRTPWLTA
ncbi:MAG TPA: ubiquinol-cytochrome c reductase iron-sulfur subunit [Acetobacteraceae bacterium]|nr:ubiquinol-cytochrome c reductase iron-sulfur subunit [Acetobacteraceae bacterium]